MENNNENNNSLIEISNNIEEEKIENKDDNLINNIDEKNTNENNIKKHILDEDYYEKVKVFFKKRTHFFNLNIEDLITVENNVFKLDVKKTIKFLLKENENPHFPLILIENYITIENEQTIIFNKKRYKDNDYIFINSEDKFLSCNTEILDGNLKLFCNLINSIVNKNIIENNKDNENFDVFKNNIGLKDGILYSDNYLNVNSSILELEPNNLLICFDESDGTQRYLIRSKDDWWCHIDNSNLNNLNYIKVKSLNFKS